MFRNKIVVFKAAWCGHCVDLMKEWEDEAWDLEADDVILEKTNPDHAHFFTHYKVKSYPTLIYFSTDGKQFKYEKKRTQSAINKWLKSVMR